VTVLYFADPADPTHATVGLDLNGLADGDPTGFQILAIDWGDIDPEITWHSDGFVPGAEQIRNHPGPVEAQITLLADFAGTDYETLLATYRTLAQFFDSEGVLVWQPDGQTNPSYIDTYPSPIPALFRGTEKQGIRIIEQLLDQGYTFSIWRHPYPRRDSVTLLSGTVLSNAVGDNVATFTNPGTAPSEARLEIAVPDAGAWVTQVRVGFRAGDSTEFQSSLSGYAISGAIPVQDFWRRIDRQKITPADPDAFAGTYRVLATMELADDVYHLELHHGSTLDAQQPLANTNEEVVLDAEEVTNYPSVEVDLGLVTYDPRSPELVLEIHAYSEGDTDMGAWGNVYLLPADEGAFIYSSPGYRSGAFGREVFRGPLLELSGSAEFSDDGDAILYANGDTAEVKPVAGHSEAEGIHVLVFRGACINRDRLRFKLAELQLYKNGSLEHQMPLRAHKGRVTTYYGGHRRRAIHFKVTNPADDYRFVVERVVPEEDISRVRIEALRHHFIPRVNDGRRFVADAGTREVRLEEDDGARIASLRATGLPYLPPGDGALAVTIGEAATHGYAGVDDRMVLPQIQTSQEVEVTLTVTPRDLHP
jgi:hypothetical protein